MAGMGREDVGQVSALISRLAEDRAILMVEHNLRVVADLCDEIVVLQRGEIIASGDYETVSRNPQVREAYMGTSDA
jgi:branched-chain amino acid transport system ATP-binding protein